MAAVRTKILQHMLYSDEKHIFSCLNKKSEFQFSKTMIVKKFKNNEHYSIVNALLL